VRGRWFEPSRDRLSDSVYLSDLSLPPQGAYAAHRHYGWVAHLCTWEISHRLKVQRLRWGNRFPQAQETRIGGVLNSHQLHETPKNRSHLWALPKGGTGMPPPGQLEGWGRPSVCPMLHNSIRTSESATKRRHYRVSINPWALADRALARR
jgi:hypothetical protein